MSHPELNPSPSNFHVLRNGDKTLVHHVFWLWSTDDLVWVLPGGDPQSFDEMKRRGWEYLGPVEKFTMMHNGAIVEPRAKAPNTRRHTNHLHSSIPFIYNNPDLPQDYKVVAVLCPEANIDPDDHSIPSFSRRHLFRLWDARTGELFHPSLLPAFTSPDHVIEFLRIFKSRMTLRRDGTLRIE